MLVKIKNKGPARTVDYLGVFAEGETREFSPAELESFQAMSGVPLFASSLMDEEQFDIEVSTQAKEG